ncbi:MAG: PD-(D/E)XK nuclease family protein [Fluviibacter phosphoraccumulans]
MALNLNGLLIDKNFIALDAKLKSGNIFRALNVEDRETIHTRFLAYLLDPNETHGLGDAFLESFLLNMWKSIDIEPDFLITDLDLDMSSVFCEWSGTESDKKRIDVLIKIPYKRNGSLFYVVAIEAKVKTKAGASQLSDYTVKLDEAGFAKEHRVCLFLVKNDDEKDQDEWHLVYWQGLVLSALRTTNERYKHLVSPKVASVLEDYVEIISQWAVDEDPLVNGLMEELIDYKPVVNNLDSKFYLEAKHRLAYNALANYFNTDERNGIKLAFKVWAQDKAVVVADSSNTYLRFYPTSTVYPFSTSFHSKTRKWVSQNYPLLFEIHITKEPKNNALKARISLVMGPLEAHCESDRETIVGDIRSVVSLADDHWTAVRSTIGGEFARVFSYPKNTEKIDPCKPNEVFDRYLKAAEKIIPKINEVLDKSILALPKTN